MKKNLILVMLLLTGAVSMTGQEAKMVVTGNMVNKGTIVSEIPIDLRQKSDGTGVITNTGEIKTPALTVDTGTTLNNEASGDICVGCEEGTPPVEPCATPAAPTGDITFSKTTLTAGGSFTATIDEVADADSYVWSLPEDKGLSITDGEGTHSVTYTTSEATTIPAGAITVAVTNDCGNTGTALLSSDAITVNEAPSGGTALAGGVYYDRTAAEIGSGAFNESAWTLVSGKKLYVATTDIGTPAANWQAAMDACSNQGNGWRLPNLAELEYIIENKTVLSNITPAKAYWSSSEHAYNPNFKWVVYSTRGIGEDLENEDGYNKLGNFAYARCVSTVDV